MSILVKKREKLTIENTPCEWVDYKDGVAFELYGMAHPLYIQAQIKQAQRVENEDLLNLSEENSYEQYVLIIGQYLVKGWRGIVDEDGENLPKSADSFADLVVAEEGLLAWIMDKCAEIQRKHGEKLEKTKKKSSKDGNTKG